MCLVKSCQAPCQNIHQSHQIISHRTLSALVSSGGETPLAALDPVALQTRRSVLYLLPWSLLPYPYVTCAWPALSLFQYLSNVQLLHANSSLILTFV